MFTLVDIFGDILMNFHAVVLIKCDFIWVQNVDTTSDSSYASGEDIRLCKMIICICWSNHTTCDYC